MLTMHKIGKF